MTARGTGDRGSTDLMLALPAAFFMTVAVIQVGLWAHAQHRVQVIAEQGVAAGRAYNAAASAGQHAAEQSLELVGGALLHDPDIQVVRGSERVEATVTARATSLVPGWQPQVRAFLTAPLERVPSGAER